MATECTATSNTECAEACIPGLTFSPTGYAPCFPCASCGYGQVRPVEMCTTTSDTLCPAECEFGVTFSETGYEPCMACDECGDFPKVMTCTTQTNTVCEYDCVDGYTWSASGKGPCNECDSCGDFPIQEQCTKYSNIVCGTYECQHFSLGDCACDFEDLGPDVLFIIDTSASVNDEDLQSLTDTLASIIEIDYPYSGRMGITRYSTKTSALLRFTDLPGRIQWAEIMRGIDGTSGGTYTRRAMHESWEFIWENNVIPDHIKYTVLVTDGNPINSQEPCVNNEPSLEVKNYLDHDVKIISAMIGEGNENSISCMGEVIHYSSWSEAIATLPMQIFEKIESNCAHQSESPFNGAYSRTSLTVFNKPVYRSSDNFEAFWDMDQWVFEDPSERLTVMRELSGTPFDFPINGSRYISDGGFDFGPQSICCLDTATPSRFPTSPPSTELSSKDPHSLRPTRSPVVMNCGLQVEALQDRITALQRRCGRNHCDDVYSNIYEIVTDTGQSQLNDWERAAHWGRLACVYVPSSFCSQIRGCQWDSLGFCKND